MTHIPVRTRPTHTGTAEGSRSWRPVLPELAIRVLEAGLLVATAGVDLHLYRLGYRDIPTIGPLFAVQVAAAAVLALAVLVTPRGFWPLATGLGAGLGSEPCLVSRSPSTTGCSALRRRARRPRSGSRSWSRSGAACCSG